MLTVIAIANNRIEQQIIIYIGDVLPRNRRSRLTSS